METLREPVLMLDPSLHIYRANRSFYRVFGLTPEATEGQLLFEIADGAWNTPDLHRLFGETLSDSGSIREYQFVHDFSGTGPRKLVLNVSRVRVQVDGHHPHAIFVAIEDVTPKFQAEEAIQAARRDLDQTTLELRRSKQELEQFARRAAHDLQAPLRAATSFVQLLARKYEKQLDADGREYTQFAVDAMQRMSRLIQDLLQYATVPDVPVRSGTNVPVDAIFQLAVLNLRRAIEEAQASVSADPLPRVAFNETQLLQVFQNLILNAITCGRPGIGPRVHISVSESRDAFTFSVTDNGEGIEEKYLEQIFEPFRRLHASENPGTGLGLALCRKIIERGGGKIWAESEIGKGSTFFFTIPA